MTTTLLETREYLEQCLPVVPTASGEGPREGGECSKSKIGKEVQVWDLALACCTDLLELHFANLTLC